MISVRSLIPIAILILGFISTSGAKSEKPIGQPLLCYGCVAVIQEAHKFLWDSSGARRTVESKFQLSSFCNTNNFVIYKFSPPKMTRACEHILGQYRNNLVPLLTQFYKKVKSKEVPRKLLEDACTLETNCCPDGLPQAGEEKFRAEGMSVDEANQKLKEGIPDQGEVLHTKKEEL